MLVTVDNLNIEFNTNTEELKKQIEEYKKLEKAIEASPYYKLLAGKTQTLGKDKGIAKKERSRLRHTIAVAGIAGKTVEKLYDAALENNPSFKKEGKLHDVFVLNKELAIIKTICIAKAHDIGHQAFGHTGELSKNNFYQVLNPNEVLTILERHKNDFGEEYEDQQGHKFDMEHNVNRGNTISFEHNESSALLFNEIVKNNDIDLSESEIRDCTLGILAHTTSRVGNFDLVDGNLPAQAVRAADKIEYRNADYDELRELLVEPENIPINDLFFKMSFRERINTIVDRLIEEAKFNGRIWEDNKDFQGRMPVILDLKNFRKKYESSIFLYDSSYSERLLREQLFPIIEEDDDKKLKEFYLNNPGVDVWYPKWKICKLYENEKYLEESASSGEVPTEEDEMMISWNSDNIMRFRSIMQGENRERSYYMYRKVLEYYYDNPDEIKDEFEVKITPIDNETEYFIKYKMNPNYSDVERVLNYITLFDDESINKEYLRLVEERIEKGIGYGINPITAHEMQTFLTEDYKKKREEFAFSKGISSRSDAEIETKYKKKAKDFYSSKLTEKGKKAYNKFYRQRFEEYGIDKKLFERMIEADKERGEEIFDWNHYYGNSDEDIYINSPDDFDVYSHVIAVDGFEDFDPEKMKELILKLAEKGLLEFRTQEKYTPVKFLGFRTEKKDTILKNDNAETEKNEEHDNHDDHDGYGE